MGDVGVLVLIDQDVAETALEVAEDVGMAGEQPQAMQQQVAEVARVHRPEPVLVGAVDLERAARSIVADIVGEDKLSDRAKLWTARGFIVLIVAITYLFSLQNPAKVFELGVWCFSGFASLFPLVFASLYWKRTTRAGAFACVIVTALVWFICLKESGYGAEDSLILGLMPVTYIFAASSVTLVLVSLLTRPPSQETLEKFFDR